MESGGIAWRATCRTRWFESEFQRLYHQWSRSRGASGSPDARDRSGSRENASTQTKLSREELGSAYSEQRSFHTQGGPPDSPARLSLAFFLRNPVRAASRDLLTPAAGLEEWT
jgi:hypothetical protein